MRMGVTALMASQWCSQMRPLRHNLAVLVGRLVMPSEIMEMPGLLVVGWGLASMNLETFLLKLTVGREELVRSPIRSQSEGLARVQMDIDIWQVREH